MKKISTLIFLIILASCSSNTTNRKYASDEQLKLEDNYNWVDSLDFDKKAETKYKADSDEFNTKKSDEQANVLVKESISTLPAPRLDEQLKDSEDPLSKIVIKCYQNKYDEAFQIVDQIYSQFKNNTSYWNQVGTCYYLKGDYSKAVLFYNKSRDLDSKFAPPVNNLGVVYQKQGRYQKALSAFKKASELNSFSITPSFNLARLYLQFGIITKAEPIITGLGKRNSNDPQVMNALATVNLIKNNYSEAINIYSALPKDFLARPEVALNYGLALKFAKKNDEAKTAISNLSEISGELKTYASKVETFIRE